MKRLAFYAGALLTVFSLTACDEDYTDWASPQSNPQQDPANAVTLSMTALPTETIDKEAAPEVVQLLQTGAVAEAPEGATVKVNTLFVNEKHVLPFTEEGGIISVNVAQLDSVVEVAYLSRQRIERELQLTVDASIIAPDGGALRTTSVPVVVKYLQETPPPVEENYYLIGVLGWTSADLLPMQSKGNGVFEATIDLLADTWFKIFPQSALVGGSINWDALLGSSIDGDTSSDAFVTWKGAQAFKAGAGKSKVTIDMVNWRYSIKPVSAELYLTGSEYGWGATWKPMVPVYGHEGEFWTLIYLNAGEEFKFAPQADWGGDFGADQLQFVDNAGAGLTGTGNVVVGNSGWYLLYVDATNKVLETYAPDVYLMGETAGEWAIAPEHKFTVPTGKDEDFVSPAFVADAELRMCVHPKEGVEWWQTEFIVLDGEIVFRGAGPDQTRVKVGAGQRAYLNFTNGTGSVK